MGITRLPYSFRAFFSVAHHRLVIAIGRLAAGIGLALAAMAAAIAKRRGSSTTTVTPTTTCEESMRISISDIDGDEPLTISPATLRFSAARMELAFREQLSEMILDGIPTEVCWLVLGSALGYANFVLDAFGSGQTLAAIIPLAALGLAAVLTTPALCLQGLFDWAPSRVLSLLASCASVLLLACPLATSVLCTTTPCSDGDGWRLAAAAQDALLVVSVLSALFAGLPMLHGCLPVLVATAAQAVVLAVRRETLFGEHHMAIECLRRGSCLLLLLLLVVFDARRREALDRAAFLTAEGGVELQMALLQQPVRPHTPPFCSPSPPPPHSWRMHRPTATHRWALRIARSGGPRASVTSRSMCGAPPPPPAPPTRTSTHTHQPTHAVDAKQKHALRPPELPDGTSYPSDAHPSPKGQCHRRCDLPAARPPEHPPSTRLNRPCCACRVRGGAPSHGARDGLGLARAERSEIDGGRLLAGGGGLDQVSE